MLRRLLSLVPVRQMLCSVADYIQSVLTTFVSSSSHLQDPMSPYPDQGWRRQQHRRSAPPTPRTSSSCAVPSTAPAPRFRCISAVGELFQGHSRVYMADLRREMRDQSQCFRQPRCRLRTRKSGSSYTTSAQTRSRTYGGTVRGRSCPAGPGMSRHSMTHLPRGGRTVST